ncbi:MAG: hypothetical protein LBM96_12685 [Methanobrevibacter sp.]|jgi:hypothetical protein|nr:hypothetical protein [Candidatus Methanoflexus mossambicus]
MKKIIFILILIGCCFTSSFAQKEKFFSLEGNVGTFPFVFSLSDDKSNNFNGEVSITPYFNIDRWKFGLGLSYSHFYYSIHAEAQVPPSGYYRHETLGKENTNFINLHLNVNFNILKTKRIQFNCFGEISMNNFVVGKGLLTEYHSGTTPNKEYNYTLERTSKIKESIGYTGTLGLELSFLLKDNLKINVASYFPIIRYRSNEYITKVIYDELNTSRVDDRNFPNTGLGFSLGVEYMFKKKL